MSVYENPANGYKESGSNAFSWLWCLLFGGVYLACNGLWRAFGIWILLVLVASLIHPGFGVFVGFIMNLLFAMAIGDVYDKKYLRQGWREVEEKPVVNENSSKEKDAA